MRISAIDSRNRGRLFVPAKWIAARQFVHFLIWTVLPFPNLVGIFIFQSREAGVVAADPFCLQLDRFDIRPSARPLPNLT